MAVSEAAASDVVSFAVFAREIFAAAFFSSPSTESTFLRVATAFGFAAGVVVAAVLRGATFLSDEEFEVDFAGMFIFRVRVQLSGD